MWKSKWVWLWMGLTCLSCRTTQPTSVILADSLACDTLVSNSSCEFYSCAETKLHCGTNGYPIAYGGRYCKKFLSRCDEILPNSEALNSWRAGTAKCLQSKFATALTEDAGLTCERAETVGFKSHGYCYTTGAVAFGGKSFCSLTSTDWYSIRGCIDATDRLSTKGLQQIVETAARCTPLLGGLFSLHDDGQDADAGIETHATLTELEAFINDTNLLLKQRQPTDIR